MTGKDSLKVVVVGNERVGKTSLIQQLLRIDSGEAVETVRRSSDVTTARTSTTRDDSTSSSLSSMSEDSSSSQSATEDESSASSSSPVVGLDMYEWDMNEVSKTPPPTNNTTTSNSLEKITMWDFSGKENFYAAQELFFTPETLYVVVWDMAANNIQPLPQQRCGAEAPPMPPPSTPFGAASRATSSCSSAFGLGYDSDSSDDDYDCDMDMYNQEEVRRHKRALDQDIDDKVQSWIDRIQCKVPGATILPVVTFADRFYVMTDVMCADKEIKKRCRALKERLLSNEDVRVADLKYRLQAEANCKGGPHKQSCRWVQDLQQRPRILFGYSEDEYGERLPHSIRSVKPSQMGSFREFLVENAQMMASSAPFPPQVAAIRDIWRGMSKHFKVIQTKHFPHNLTLSDEDLEKVLECLHRSGELCYFPRTVAGTVTDLIVLDPTWMVESVDFVLRNAANKPSSCNILCDATDGESQSFRDKVRTMWSNRPSTKASLLLAQQVSDNIDDEIFSCILNQLVHHDVIANLSGHKGPRDLFMPGTLSKRDFTNGCASSINCPLLHLGAAGLFSQSLCHALTFLERVPSKLLERIAIQIIQTLESSDAAVSNVSIKKFHCWSDSFVLELDMTTDGQQRQLEIQSFLLHAREEDYDAPCYSVCNKSMFVTCMRESRDGHRIDAWKPVCSSLRKAIQKGLDELPGAEYKDAGVCPECLMKKSVGEIGTWPFSKIQCVLDDQETTIRCGNGHCVDVNTVQGLVGCELGKPQPDFSCCVPRKVKPVIFTKAVEQVAQKNTQDVSKKFGRAASEEMPMPKVQPLPPAPRSQTVPATVGSSGRSDDATDPVSVMKLEQVKKAVQEYEASTKKRFFGIKKAKLRLDNLQLRESHLPLDQLIDTPLGQKLEHFSLSGNLFESIPSSLVLSLPNLKSLDLSGCTINKLPEKWDLPKLKKLNLSNNMLASFPGDVMLSGMPELEELNLSGNRIKKVTLPSDPRALKKLKTLDLSMNKISQLPTDLGRLGSLKVFDVQHNPVKHVPVDIVSSMNSFLVEAVRDPKPSKGSKAMFGRKSSAGDKRSGSPLNKHISMTRDTQNTAPLDENSVIY